MLHPPPTPEHDENELTPEEQQAWEAGLDRVAHEKREALREPGPGWKEWFFYSHAKVWVGLAFLVVDSWIAAAWVSGGGVTAVGLVEMGASLAAALYLELLIYRYLWRQPSGASAGPFRPSWRALTRVGRWTPEAAAVRAGKVPPPPADGSPNPHEFL